MLVIVLSVVFLLLAGCGVGAFFLVRATKGNADLANNFLRDLRDQRFASAHGRLCADDRRRLSESEFTARASAARASNHGVSKFDINSVHTNNTNGFVVRTAGGPVTFTDGTTQQELFTLGKENGHLCVSSGYEPLLG